MKALERIGKWLIALSDEWVTKRDLLEDLEEIRAQAADRWGELNRLCGTVGDVLLRLKNHEGAAKAVALGLDELKSALADLTKATKERMLHYGGRIADLESSMKAAWEEIERQKQLQRDETTSEAIRDLQSHLSEVEISASKRFNEIAEILKKINW
jgi:hypothetical protein